MKIFTTGRLAMLLGIHPSKIYRLMRKGELPSYRPRGLNWWLIPLSDEEIELLLAKYGGKKEDVEKYALGEDFLLREVANEKTG
jgi:excisionase family DNA binding protein